MNKSVKSVESLIGRARKKIKENIQKAKG